MNGLDGYAEKLIIDDFSRKCFFRFFPGMLEHFVKSATLVSVSPAERFISFNDKIDHIYFPIDGNVRLSLPTGRLGDETKIGEVDKHTPIGLKDLFSKRNYSYSVTVEKPINFLRVPKQVVTDAIGSEEKSLRISLLLTAVSALRNFVNEFSNAGMDHSKIMKFLELVPTESLKFEKFETFDVREPSFIFIQEGQLKISSYEDSSTSVNLVGVGEWTGAFYLDQDAADLDLEIIAIQPTKVYAVSVKTIREIFGNQALKRFSEVETIGKNSATRVAIASQLTSVTALDLGTLEGLGHSVDIKKLVFDPDPQNWAFATINNTCVFHHIDLNAASIQADLSVLPHLSLGRLAEIIERQGMITRALRCRPSRLSKQFFPLIIPFGQRPCLLVGIQGETHFVLDPLLGLQTYNSLNFAKHWNGQALEILGSPIEEVMGDAMKRKFSGNVERIADHVLHSLFNQDKPIYRNLFLLGLFVTLLESLFPQFFKYVIDVDLLQRNFQATKALVCGFGLVCVALAVCTSAKKVISKMQLNELTLSVRSLLLRQLMQLPNDFAGDAKTSNTAAQLELIDHISLAGHHVREELWVAAISTVIYFTIACIYSWQIGILLAIGATLVTYAKRFYMDQKLHDLPGTTPLRGDAKTAFGEQIESIGQIKSTNSEASAVSKTERLYLDTTKTYYRLALLVVNGWGVAGVGKGVLIAGSVALLIWGAMTGRITPGEFVAELLYLTCFWQMLSELNAIIGEKQFFNLEASVYRRFVRSEVEYSSAYARNTKSIPLTGKIVFDKVSHRYEGTANFILSEVSFTAMPGEIIAIVGKTGAGKTSIAKLVAGLAKPTSGNIYFDDINSRALSSFCLHDHIGYVEQRPVLMTGTIASNIALGDDSPDYERIEAAARASSAYRFIEALPDGYQHFLYNNGRDLSAGQRMQLSIARILYKNPQILIIDEADVNLDPITVKLLSENLKEFMVNKTVIIISQRLSALQKVDKILVLKNGIFVESGNHDALIKNNREYVELFRAQVSSY